MPARRGAPAKGGHFQVKLGGEWKDYSPEEDKILKRAYMAGFPNTKFSLRGQQYEYNFGRSTQTNQNTGKTREIRPPHGWKQPSKPLVPPGQTTVITVPPGSPGTTIQVPWPGKPGEFISVNVPASARPGQAMLVPIPKGGSGRPDAPAPAAPAKDGGSGGGGGWSTGGKVAATGAAVVGVAGVAVGGAILGEHIAEHGVDATVDAAGDGLADGADAIEEFAVDAGEFMVDAGESAGDFIMDLF